MNFDGNNPLENGDDVTGQSEDRILDLVIQRATSGLSDREQRELDQLVSKSDQRILQSQLGQEKIELAAAALDLSMVSLDELPEAVRDQVLFKAGQYFKPDSSSLDLSARNRIQAAIDARSLSPNEVSKVRPSSGKPSRGFTWREMLALAVTAASLALLVSGWNPFANSSNQTSIAKNPVGVSAAQKMARLIESKPTDLVRESWIQVDKNYVGAGGEVLWSDEAQEGYMVFTGIKANDSGVEQFQLWIFDTDPTQEHPVDGGVFDIAASDYDSEGKIVIPIKLHIPVEKAVQFAVTVERPGGVTVSKRERIPVLAKLASVN